MSYVTEATAWLSDDIGQDVKTLVARFYELADSKSADAGPRMASEVFSPDGVLISPSGTSRGSEEISKSRANAWGAVASRKHAVSKAFSGRSETQELILLGSVHMDFKPGKALDSTFSCHVKLAPHTELSQPRISYMEVYVDAAAFAAASAKK